MCARVDNEFSSALIVLVFRQQRGPYNISGGKGLGGLRFINSIHHGGGGGILGVKLCKLFTRKPSLLNRKLSQWS